MIDAYRQDYEQFNTELMRESYLYNSGQKAELAIAPIYDRYSHLFDKAAISGLRQTLDETSHSFSTRRASISHFLVFAVNQFLDSSVKSLTEQITRREAEANAVWKDRKMTFQDSAVAISTEPVRQTRDQIYDWRVSVITGSNDLRLERLEKLHEAARAIGFSGNHNGSSPKGPSPNGNAAAAIASGSPEGPRARGSNADSPGAPSLDSSYRGLYGALYELNLDSIAKQCESLLARTESVYVARLSDALKRDLGVSIDQATRPDGMYFMHLPRYHEKFPSADIVKVYGATMEGIGIKTHGQSNILIDDEPRPHKSPRAFCAPIRVPGEVRLVIRPFGGQADYMSFLHEAGHAQHYGWTSPALDPEFKYTGDSALTETYAFLFNHLPSDRSWLDRFLGFRESRDFVDSSMLSRLFTVRRYAGKFIFELNLHSGRALTDAGDAYSELLTGATKFQTGEAEYLFDTDDAFYAAGYLRAWAFEVALREHLATRFGKPWWTSRRAGNFLKEIWETGDRYTADEIADQIGIGPINFDLLTDEFLKALH
jgi:hypothetical protein